MTRTHVEHEHVHNLLETRFCGDRDSNIARSSTVSVALSYFLTSHFRKLSLHSTALRCKHGFGGTRRFLANFTDSNNKGVSSRRDLFLLIRTPLGSNCLCDPRESRAQKNENTKRRRESSRFGKCRADPSGDHLTKLQKQACTLKQSDVFTNGFSS